MVVKPGPFFEACVSNCFYISSKQWCRESSRVRSWSTFRNCTSQLTSPWQLAISHGGNTYTTAISKPYKSKLLCPINQFLNIYKHTTSWDSDICMLGIFLWYMWSCVCVSLYFFRDIWGFWWGVWRKPNQTRKRENKSVHTFEMLSMCKALW